jgi:hypothetical protein
VFHMTKHSSLRCTYFEFFKLNKLLYPKDKYLCELFINIVSSVKTAELVHFRYRIDEYKIANYLLDGLNIIATPDKTIVITPP